MTAQATSRTNPQTSRRQSLPVGAGSGVDTIVRAASAALGKALGHPVVIENQPGAGGIVGTSALVKAAPDGMEAMVRHGNTINPGSPEAAARTSAANG